MEGLSKPAPRYGTRAGVRQSDVSHAADALLRAGDRPSVEKIRSKLGGGSPNTINPLLDAWWKTLGARLDSGPAALHRLPESVAHVAEALWMQAVEESRRRVLLEQRESDRVATLDKERLELRSHVLSLREGELDSRLHDRDRTIEDLQRQLRELTGILRKEQVTRQFLTRKIADPTSAAAIAATKQAPQETAKRRTSKSSRRPPPKKGKQRKRR